MKYKLFQLFVVMSLVFGIVVSHQHLSKDIDILADVVVDHKSQTRSTFGKAAKYIRAHGRSINRLRNRARSELSVMDKALRCTVLVRVEMYDGSVKRGAGSGSGVWISPTHILTAKHVVVDQQVKVSSYDAKSKQWSFRMVTLKPRFTIEVFNQDNSTVDKYPAMVHMEDGNSDLATLIVAGYESPYVAKIASEDQMRSLRIHDTVYAGGSPLGVSPRLTRGHLTALYHAEDGYIESDCMLYRGNSGGALFKDGYIIGIVSLGRIGKIGIGLQMITHLGLCVSPYLIHDFVSGLDI